MPEMERELGETAREYAKRVMRQKIIDLELIPGTLVSENELASLIGVSRTPIREALVDLARYQVVETLPQKGIRISLIDYEQVEEARSTREMLETGILPLVCERIMERDVEELRDIIDSQMDAMRRGEEHRREMLALDDAFHCALFRIARRENTRKLIEDLSVHFDRVRGLALDVVKDRSIIQDHIEICEAVARKDVDYARRTMKMHLNRSKLDAEAICKAYPHMIK